VKRLAYIDWMRGLACVLMFQSHCYAAWPRPEIEETQFAKWSQLLGTLPAPLFLFLAGVSVALTTQKLREKGTNRGVVAKQTILRGGEIFGLGLLFRIQEYALGHRWVPWTDLLRVDILNILGFSMMVLGILCWLVSAQSVESARRRSLYAGVLTAAAISLFTPPLWSTWRPSFLPWPLESYINGIHTASEPQSWLFPIFPWCAFAFVGLAAGFSLFSDFARKKERRFFAGMAGVGAAGILLSLLFQWLPVRIYAREDYWHSGPNFFLLRCGLLLMIMALSYAWCGIGWGQLGFSPVIQLGTTSLLVYWVHIEFVYGRFSILRKHECTLGQATIGLLVIFLSMVALSLWRTEAKAKPVRALPLQPQSVSAPAV
jgi:uncharacterized membrane protein